ncbi:hypothetical protein [Micromonospora sp. WMMD714]|uniref:hypothetical protein n=1 Tax=Micromonospora sp. WMMD714 TaxID=3016097 RepID=UPI00249CC603|nr:hypothetical protein [Micromonospora sp. WMMD714]WFE66718.1 hypothetical protein O7625_26980 [Micromonospora sp. WMMD714]
MPRLPAILLASVLALVIVAPAGPAAAHRADPGVRSGSTVDLRPGRPALGTDLLSVRGAGPFRIGASLTRLTSAGLIAWTVVGCDGTVDAGVTGEWAGVILVTFRDGRLVEVGTATAPPRSPAGASVGMTFAELEEIYGPRGALIHNDAGDATAYLVRYGDRVELFTGHPIRPGVGYFQAGLADHVERAFRQGPSC